MTGLLLATLLNLAPGIQLADNVEARNVALSEARFPLLFVSDDESGVKPSLDVMTREQLAAELRRLDSTRPSIVGPIVLLSIGAPLAIVGGVLVATGLGTVAFSSSTSSSAILGYLLVGFGAIVVTVGIILAIVGGILIATRAVARGRHSAEVEEVQKKIDELDQTIPIAPPPPGPDLMPPPPPPPPQANFVIPGRLQTVMTF